MCKVTLAYIRLTSIGKLMQPREQLLNKKENIAEYSALKVDFCLEGGFENSNAV